MPSDDAGTPVLRHVLPVVGASAPSRLLVAQEQTLASIARARGFSQGRVHADVVGARFPDEDLPSIEWLGDAPVLRTSSRDLQEFRIPRRLPLLREVLEAFGDTSGCDALILTNSDIGVQPSFYEVVVDILGLGYDAFTINRRSLSPVLGAGGSALGQAGVGRSHPGTDCFVLRPALLEKVDVGRVLLGTRFVARTLLEELEVHADRFREFGELHATFHVGDDRPWRRAELSDYDAFNRDEFERRRSERSKGGASGPGPVLMRSADHRFRTERRDSRLIFCAAPARSGTMFLAELLGTSPGVDAGHERPPTMSGPWLDDVERFGLAATSRHRRAKVDAIESDLRRSPDATYVDTSHLFLTMFHDIVLDAFDHRRLTIVALRRDPVQVARSMFELGWLSDANDRWRGWFLDPVGTASGVEASSADVRDPLDAIFLYLAGVLARREWLRGMTPTVEWVDVDFPALLSRRGRRGVLDSLGLPYPKGRGGPRRTAVNGRQHLKREVGTTITEGEVRERFDRNLARFEGRAGFAVLRDEVARWRTARR